MFMYVEAAETGLNRFILCKRMRYGLYVEHKQVHWISLSFVSLLFCLSHLEIYCVLNSRLLLHSIIYLSTGRVVGAAVAQWLRCCGTNLKVAGSIPAGVIGIFL